MWRELCQFCLLMLVRPGKDDVLDELQFQLMQIFDKFTIKTKVFNNVFKYFFKPGVNMPPEKLLMKLLTLCETQRDSCAHDGGDARSIYLCFEALEQRKRCFSQEHWQYLMEHEERTLSGK